MSGNLEGFNASDIEPQQAFTPIPAGDYQVIITESELKTTKAGTGQYLKLKLQVLNGQHQNRVLFDNVNIKNPNETCQQIGQGTLSSICRAVNVLTPKDSAELHNKPLTAVVKVGVDQNNNPNNEVKGYKPRHTQPAAGPNMVEQAFETQAPSGEKPNPF